MGGSQKPLLNTDRLIDAASETLRILNEYKGVKGVDEFGVDRVFYGFLRGRYSAIKRQHGVAAGRIDFRYGTTNPAVIELVVRNPKDGKGRLYASQNLPELQKLSQVATNTAKYRFLLLLDRGPEPLESEHLRRLYANVVIGGKVFGTHSVRVAYVHVENDFDFAWSVENGIVKVRPKPAD